ncbi:hypothetical protein [Acinetobacter bouvetii]|uniref:Uncharacterized protein n=1 Tax=Acinetobacter bouvetii TaxID=202951 RepID=A0A811G7E4_9GAMM|nr:hypothetical protein [Acinetobacter bouvetii]CAB1207590.1 hypothetical protein SFB21_0186 [Acinetobacter bouvetii]
MSIKRALELIMAAKSFQCVLYPDPPNGIRWASQKMPPDEFLDDLRVNKASLVEYFSYTDRDLTPFFVRAFDGYLYCLNQVNKGASNIGRSAHPVSTLYWRFTVKEALQLSNPELELIEKFLIEEKCLKYLDDSRTELITPEQEQQKYSPDRDAGTAFNDLLSKRRQFIYC